MSRPTTCMNTKCIALISNGNISEGEIGTFWYECMNDFDEAGKCPSGVSVTDFKEKKAEFTIKDSGKRVEFSTGMIRDSEDKIRYDLIPIWFLERFAEHLTKGAKKYSAKNWELAETEEELERFIQSAWRHFIALLRNETDEDHMAALTFNLCGIELVREQLKNKLNKE